MNRRLDPSTSTKPESDTMSVNPDIESDSQSPQNPITAEPNHRRTQSPQNPIVSVEKKEDKAIDEADCIEVDEGKMVTFNDNQRAAPIHCLKMVGSQKARKNVRLQTTEQIEFQLSEHLSAVELEELSKKLVARKQPFPTDDHDVCKDGQCLEVQIGIDLDVLGHLDEFAQDYLVFYIRKIRGGDYVFFRFADSLLSRFKLYSVSVTTAIEDAGIDKMKELGVNEQHFELRDIPKSELFFRSNDPEVLSTNISQWLAEVFGGSSQKFRLTGTMVRWPDKVTTVDCTFRGDAPIDDCLVDYPVSWAPGDAAFDQDICITKVDNEVAIDDLLDFESATFVSQIGHSVVQNPWISHSIVFGIGCVLPPIFKSIIKKMAPRRVRRRIMRPRMLSQNQDDENMRYSMMTGDV